MDTFALIVAAALAANNIADILTGGQESNQGLFERPRSWFQSAFPRLGKLAVCQYCQSFWLSCLFVVGLAALPTITMLVIMPLAIHRVCQFLFEFFDRYLNRAPLSVFVTGWAPTDLPKEKPKKEEPSKESITILINGRKMKAYPLVYDYTSIVSEMAKFPMSHRALPTVTYSNGGSDKPCGVLAYGETIQLWDGMIFDIAFTISA